MKLTRRTLLAGAAAIPVAAGFDRMALAASLTPAVIVYDPLLRQANALSQDPAALPVTGDRIRFAREIFARRPALVRGLTRQADALLLEDVGREAGYERVALSRAGAALDWTLAPRLG